MKINKKGYIYTLSAILLILVLIFFIVFYSRFTETATKDLTEKISCDELHFFVENIKTDLNRSLTVSGRRAAIYAIDSVVYKGVPLKYYNSSYFPELNGSIAAVSDLFFNGTLNVNGTAVQSDYMVNNTLSDWINKMYTASENTTFNIFINVTNLTINPYDAWNFIVYVNLTFNISDKNEMCFYENNLSVSSISSIEGLEDAMYPLNTLGVVTKAMDNCSSNFYLYDVLNGTEGWNWASGNPIFALTEGEFGEINASANKSNILAVKCIDYSAFTSSDCVDYNSYKDNLNKYAGIITTRSNTDTLNGLKNLDIPYIAGATGIPNLIALNVSENETVVLDGSQFYFVNLDYFGTNATCSSRRIWFDEAGNSTGTQIGWFSELNKTDNSVSHSDYVKFLFPTYSWFEDSLCKIAPQLEPDNTWQYFPQFPLRSKNLHLIASSKGTGEYKVTIYYADDSEQDFMVTINAYCLSTISGAECNDCFGREYNSHFVSRNNKTGYVFETVFSSISGSICANPGVTVQHITIPLDTTKYVGGIAINDPDTSIDGPNPAIWAVTIETAPTDVWVVNSSIKNNSFFGCYRESNVCPSFFDKLEGSYNLSDKYKNMAPPGVKIGLESFVNVSELNTTYQLEPYFDRTALDCLYFEGNTTGYKLKGIDKFGLGDFRIHENYLYNYSGDYQMGDLSYNLILWEYITPRLEIGAIEHNLSLPWWPSFIPGGGGGGGGGGEGASVYSSIAGDADNVIDRDFGSVQINDSVVLTARLSDNKSNYLVTFKAEMTDPDILGQNITKILGSNRTNSSGYTSIVFSPNSSYYAGSYIWWAEASGYEDSAGKILYIYGTLNTTFKNSSVNPNAVYNASNNDTIIIDAMVDSSGPETNIQLKFNYSSNGHATLSEPGGIEHVVELIDPLSHFWWDFSYQYVQQLNVTTNSSPVEKNYSVKFTINTTGDGFMDDGIDLRVLYFNGTGYVELDRINETPFNSTNTEVWFKIQKNITNYDDNYWIYYGNPDAGSPPNNRSRVYLWWDDFSTNTTANYEIDRHTDSWHGQKKKIDYHVYDGTELAVYFNTTAEYTGDWMPIGINETNVLAEMTMKVIRTYGSNTSNNATNGIVLRWTDDKNFYAGHMSGGVHDSPCISKDKREPTMQCKTPTEYFPINGTVFKLAFAAWNSSLKLWYNGVEKVSANDTTHSTAGRIAFVVSQSEGWMDNFKIRKYVVNEPSVSAGSVKTVYDFQTSNPELWNGTFQLNQNLSRGVWQVTLNTAADYFISVPVNRSFNVTGGVEPTFFGTWDEEDDSENKPPPPINWTEKPVIKTNETTYFWANYTNYTSSEVITGAACRIWFSDTNWSDMSYNSSWQLYYYNRSFSQAGTQVWNISCSKQGFRSRERSSTISTVFPANLGIWDDENESNVIFMLENTYFWANYTNYTNGAVITNATCMIWFNETGWSGWSSMDYNSTRGLYYHNRSFFQAGNYTWNVTCSDPYYENKTTFSNISIEQIAINVSSPPDETLIDRDSVNSTVPDEVALVANLNDGRENISVIFYANLTQPINITNIIIGTNYSNSTGNVSFIWNPNSTYYAGNYTWWAESYLYETRNSRFLYVYGGLNISFRYSNVNPNGTYNATDNEAVTIDALLHSLGPESDILLNSTYNAGVNLTLAEPNGTNYTNESVFSELNI